MTLVALFAMTAGAWAQATALNLTSPAVGQVIGDDGKNYAYASLPSGVTAVAKICYVSGDHGLALALADETGTMDWSTAISTCAAHTPAITGGTWKLATKDEWNNMITAAGSATALRTGFEGVGGSNLQSDDYWSSTEVDSYFAYPYNFDSGGWSFNNKGNVAYVRACLAWAGLEVTWDAATKQATFTMPASDVVLTPIYAPVAQWATTGTEPNVTTLAPTAADGIIAGTDASLIAEGTGIVAFAGTSTEVTQGTVMYAIGTSATTAPALTAFSATVPTAENVGDDGGNVYVWYYIQGADAPANVAATLDNTFENTEPACLTVIVLSNKFDITFTAANTLTIEGGKATVSVKTGDAAAVDKTADIANNKLTDVKMGSTVTITAATGYKFSALTATKGTETTNLATLSTDKTTATITMAASDVSVNYTLKRDMAVDVDATIANRIRIKKENNVYVVVTDGQLTPAVSDKISGTAVAMTVTTDYTVKLQKKVEGDTPSWADATALSVGTFRYVITGAGLYDGEITTNEFQLFEGYEVTIPAGEYITYYRDEPLKLDDNETNAELYTISAVGTETATLSGPYDAMKALTPMLVHNKNTEEAKTILLIPCNEPDLALTVAPEFKGTLEATEIAASSATSNNYAFNGLQFVWVKTALAVGQYKAWLEVPTGTQSAPVLTIVFEGGTTKITNTNVPNITNGNWYDLNGRKLNGMPSKKGVYILNGKKVVVK